MQFQFHANCLSGLHLVSDFKSSTSFHVNSFHNPGLFTKMLAYFQTDRIRFSLK